MNMPETNTSVPLKEKEQVLDDTLEVLGTLLFSSIIFDF